MNKIVKIVFFLIYFQQVLVGQTDVSKAINIGFYERYEIEVGHNNLDESNGRSRELKLDDRLT